MTILSDVGTVKSNIDQELAAQYREEMILALQNVMEILGRARRQGLILGFTLQVDQNGRDFIAGNGISVVRHY